MEGKYPSLELCEATQLQALARNNKNNYFKQEPDYVYKFTENQPTYLLPPLGS